MIVDIIDSKNFDARLFKLLNDKKDENVARGRFDIENITLERKADFIITLLSSFKFIKGITYKILFWEKDEVIRELFDINFNKKNYDINISYGNEESPGVLFVDDSIIDESFLRLLLNNHFNYEMGVEPALNLRVQICLNQEKFITVLDIYDDRGFDMYYLGYL